MLPVNATQTIDPEITDVWCHSASGEQIFDRLHPGEDGFANGLAFAVSDGIAAGDYILVAQRMNPDRRSFARARHKVRI